jgi:hypothetical protein
MLAVLRRMQVGIVKECNLEVHKNRPILYSFSSVTHVCVPGAKTTGTIVKMFGFS